MQNIYVKNLGQQKDLQIRSNLSLLKVILMIKFCQNQLKNLLKAI